MSNNANSRVRVKNGRKLLDLCKELKRWTEINSLLNENTDVNLTNSLGRSPLHYASEKACLDLITKLIELGADVHYRENERGYTPLHFATSSGKTPAIKLLLEAGAYVNATADYGVTPLHIAARSGPISVVKCLIKEGADVDAKECVFNFTPLLTATYNNSDEIMDVLIKKGDSYVNYAADDGLTALHIASMTGAIKSVRRLIENGANVHCTTHNSQITPLHLASMNGCFLSIPAFEKFCPKSKDMKHILDKIEPFKYLEDEDFESVVKILIENEADLQAKDISGASPLHFAVRHQSKVLKTLLKYDADVIAQDNNGRLPFHEALEHGVGLDWLLRYGADINDIDESYTTEHVELIMKRCRFKHHLLEHFIKLMAAELPIADVYKPYIEINYYKSYLNECRKELVKMKNLKIEEGVTFYDLMHTVVSPQLTYELPHNVEFKFPKYHGILRACCYAPLKRRQLLDSARLAWYHITDVNLPAICLELILEYLSTSNLKIIVRGARRMPALKP